MPALSGSEIVRLTAPNRWAQGLGQVIRRECHAPTVGHRHMESPPRRKVKALADRTLALAIFDDEAAADNAAAGLKDSGLTSTDAVGGSAGRRDRKAEGGEGRRPEHRQGRRCRSGALSPRPGPGTPGCDGNSPDFPRNHLEDR